MLYKTVGTHFCHAKLPRIIYLLYPQHAVRAVDHFLYVVLADGVSQRNKNFVVTYNFLG